MTLLGNLEIVASPAFVIEVFLQLLFHEVEAGQGGL